MMFRLFLVLVAAALLLSTWTGGVFGGIGECCWNGGCTGCAEPGNWCSFSEANCNECGAEWCPGLGALDCDASSVPNGVIAGALSVNINGVDETYYVMQSGGANGGVTTSSKSISMTHGNRAYLTPVCKDTIVPEAFQGVQLLGGTLAFTVDISEVGCGCNAAFYGVEMPGRNSNGEPDAGSCSDYYCDGFGSCGVYCEELDVMEANQFAFHSATHSCPTDDGIFYASCGASNCYSNTKYDNTVGPGPEYTINTNLPFDVRATYNINDDNILTSIETVLSQGTNTLTRMQDGSTDCGAELNKITDSMVRGVTLTMSFWGDSGSLMQWLDVPPCSINQGCAKSGTKWTISDIKIVADVCDALPKTKLECESKCKKTGNGFTFVEAEDSTSDCAVCACIECSGVEKASISECKTYCDSIDERFSFFSEIDPKTECANRCHCREGCPGFYATTISSCDDKCSLRGMHFYNWDSSSHGGDCTKRCICDYCPPSMPSLSSCKDHCLSTGGAFVSYNSQGDMADCPSTSCKCAYLE
eukprot:m.29777 g.29777  ORF g.29777 m.29777 type:complete len:530 (+) comp9599_c0_seq1:237-1826(+)